MAILFTVLHRLAHVLRVNAVKQCHRFDLDDRKYITYEICRTCKQVNPAGRVFE